MEGENDHGPATSQLTPLQVDLVKPPKDIRNTLIGKSVKDSEELDEFDKISEHWPEPKPDALNIIVELPRGKRWMQWVSAILLTALLSVCHFTTSLLSTSFLNLLRLSSILSFSPAVPGDRSPTLINVFGECFIRFFVLAKNI
jgi:hypothetical protein